MAQGTDPLTGVTYAHTDHLGSTTLVTKADGTVLEQVVYRPYGRAVAPAAGKTATVPEFGFTGQRFAQAAGIYDYGARFYDPTLGRFLQPDSIVPNATHPQSLNPYSYVENNPLNQVDPTGNFSIGGFFGGVGSFFNNNLFSPIGSFASGFGAAVGYSLGFSGPPSGSGFLYNQGVGAGSLIGGVVGVGSKAIQAPFQVGAGLLQAIPGIPQSVTSAANSVSNAVGSYSLGVSERADSLRASNLSPLSVIADDVLSSQGFLGNATGLVSGAEETLGGLSSLSGSQARNGVGSFLDALVPRYGLYSGPGWGYLATVPLGTPAFNNSIDKSAFIHDQRYHDPNYPRRSADLALARGVWTGGSQYQPGPVGQVYRVGLWALFEGKAHLWDSRSR